MHNNLKRIQATCISQILHFRLKEGEYAIRAVKEEVKRYKEGLDRGHTKYKILSEEEQPDGSVIIEIKKQYNTAPVGAYLD